MANSTIYTIGGTTIYWTSSSTPFAQVSRNNDSVYTLETANSFLRALDLSKPVDFEVEFSDTSEVISELPFEIPLAIGGALWVDQNTIHYWGGKLLFEPIYLDGAFQNRTREWPDPMKYYTYDLSQPSGFGTWKTVSIAEAMGSDMLTSSPAWGEFTYAPEVRKGFYLGGVVRKDEFKNKDGSNATRAGIVPYYLRSMVVFNTVKNVWKNETIALELDRMTDGVMVYVAGVGEEGILVGFDIVYIYDIAAGVWYHQPTTSKIKIFPEGRQEGFCAAAVAAPDKTGFTIYIYGGYNGIIGNIKGTWACWITYRAWGLEDVVRACD
ncbi:hypothetical protein HOY82DRAFT_651131 [Tuber indicum]|nr:hypothetical protein HOY82DRAFT_651131 [Tuber indicum]